MDYSDVFVPTGSPSMTQDYYTYVSEIVDKNGSCMFYCAGDYTWLKNVKAGEQKLYDEGYIRRASGCDEEWVKESKDD